MSNEANLFAFRNALDEIKKVCPDITTTLIFKENGEILAKDQDTTQEAANNAREALNALAEKADVIGGIESMSIQGVEATVNIAHFDEFYVTNVVSKGADEKIVSNLTRVLIPTMLKLVQEIEPSQKYFSETKQELPLEKRESEISSYEPTLPEAQNTSLLVDNLTGISGLRRDQEEVRLDRALIAQWEEMFGEKSTEEVAVANPTNGKSIRCVFKPIKESKNEEKGIVQLSEKIKLALKVQKGTHVLVKPIIKNKNDLTTDAKEKDSAESKSEAKTQSHYEIYVQNSQANQFMVENLKRIGNFLGNSDIVQIDRAAIASWKEQFGDKDIKEVSIEETRTGKKVRCKFQPIKDSKLEGKGILQIPEKIQLALQTKKGALVIVKPIVEEEEP